MHDLFLIIVRNLRGVWRYRWWMLSFAWFLSIVGWIVVAKLPDQYEAKATVYVDTETVLKPMLGGLTIETINPQKKIDLITRSLLSRSNLEKVMRMTDMDIRAKTEADKESILEELKQHITKKGTKKDNFYSIGYIGTEPQLTKDVVKSLLTIFMEGNIGDSRKQQDSAMRFLEQQSQEYEERLRNSEEDLKRFKQENIAYLASAAGNYYQRLNISREALKQAKLNLEIERDRLDVLRSQIEGEEPVFGLMEAAEVVTMEAGIDTRRFDSRITNIETQLDEMKLRYTIRHPDVIITQQLLDDLVRQKEAFIVEAKKKIPRSARAKRQQNLMQNPVFQQLKISFAEAEARLSEKETVFNSYTERVSLLEDEVDKALLVETEQSQMNRDYGLVKDNYNKLLSRIEAAKLSASVGNRVDSVQFKVIEAPRVPQYPSAPNRILLSSAVLAISFLIGAGIALLLSLMRPVFDDRAMLESKIGIPVLGTVNMVWTSEQIKNRRVRHISFLFAFTGLIISFGIVLALYMLQINVISSFAKLLGMG